MTKQDIIKTTKKLFKNKFKLVPTVISIAPGRINLIGEHLDYNNGVAMPSAINRWVCVCISKRKDNKIVVYSENLKSELIINYSLREKPKALWHKYILGSLKIFKNKYKAIKGVNIFIYGNIPIGSGLSSSAALEVALLSSYLKLYDIKIEKIELAELCQKIEHDYLLINSGLLDQLSSIYSKENHYMFIDFRDHSIKYIENKIHNSSLLIIDSNIKRELVDTNYIKRVEECQEGFKLLQESRIDRITTSSLGKLDKYPKIKNRFRHLISEYRRAHQMQYCVSAGNIIDAGKILNESHVSLKNDYQVSCDEIDFIIDSSLEFPSWYGGRIMGGGFGGCIINFIDKNTINEYEEIISKNYKTQFNINLKFYDLEIVKGAMVEL